MNKKSAFAYGVAAYVVFLGVYLAFAGFLLQPESREGGGPHFHAGMSIKQISPRLGVTGKALARELDIPVVALSQVRRESEGKQPNLGHQQQFARR